MKIKTFLTNPDDSKFIEIQDHELVSNKIEARLLTSDFKIEIKAIESKDEEHIHELQVVLFINENEEDRKFFNVKIIP